MDCSQPDSSVHGILQARILEWVAIPSSRDLPNSGIEPESLMSPALAGRFFTTSTTWEAHSEVKIAQLCLILCNAHGLHSPRNTPGQNTGVGSCFLLQRIFPTQGSNPGLPHCRWILHQLSHSLTQKLKFIPFHLLV